MAVVSMKPPSPDEVRNYSRLLRSAMGSSFLFAPQTEFGSAVQVERGTVFPMCMSGHAAAGLVDRIDRLVELSSLESMDKVTVVDRAGHSRPAYPGLLVYCWAQACRMSGTQGKTIVDTWREPLRTWCGVLEAQVKRFEWMIGGLPALRGAGATAAAWAALALYSAGSVLADRRWSELASNCFGRLAAGQQGSGAFLRASAADNPETFWYHELVLLHAAASYAAQSNDALVTAAVMQAAEYHLNETQPDHASNQPWGLLAFIWRRDARSLADQMLHTLTVQEPDHSNGVSSMLLADGLYCLGLLK
jgi:hypothetical protein